MSQVVSVGGALARLLLQNKASRSISYSLDGILVHHKYTLILLVFTAKFHSKVWSYATFAEPGILPVPPLMEI